MTKNWIIVATITIILGANQACKSTGGEGGSTPGTGNNGGQQLPPEEPGKMPGETETTWEPNPKDAQAVAMGKRLQQTFSPNGLVFGALFTQPDSGEILRLEGVADSALWSGAYLAAASFEFKVTKSAEAYSNARRTLEAIRKLSLINGDGLLARYTYALNEPTIQHFLNENPELVNVQRKSLEGVEYYYGTRTSRDQYAGIFFGLGVAYDLLGDQESRTLISSIVTRLVEYLLRNGWNTFNPDGSVRTSFLQMPQQKLSILNLARHVNPARFTDDYKKLRAAEANKTWIPHYVEGIDPDNSYYKYNLNHLYVYNLIRLEEKDSPYMVEYKKAYNYLQASVTAHINAHFNMIDRAIIGPNATRDAETIKMLDQLYARGFKLETVDLRGKYRECKPNRACDAIPVSERLRTYFLWQTPPWDIYMEGDERIESPGGDYLLSYWMSRYYKVQ